jgi:hypothetical protein
LQLPKGSDASGVHVAEVASGVAQTPALQARVLAQGREPSQLAPLAASAVHWPATSGVALRLAPLQTVPNAQSPSR